MCALLFVCVREHVDGCEDVEVERRPVGDVAVARTVAEALTSSFLSPGHSCFWIGLSLLNDLSPALSS